MIGRMSELKVGVLGARGRMGSESVRAIEAAEGLSLVAALDADDALEGLVDAGAEVVVDFTNPAAVMDNLRFCVTHGIHAVVGTSGFDDARIDEVRTIAAESPEVGVLIVPNFSIGAVLMMRFAQIAAPYFESVEIVELHHPGKVDAPSGTATRTAELIAEARREAGTGPSPDATTSDPLGARGAVLDGVHVHAVRSRGLVAHQEVLFGDVGETLTIRHDSVHRESFMPGVVAGVRGVGSRPGVTVGLDAVLGLA